MSFLPLKNYKLTLSGWILIISNLLLLIIGLILKWKLFDLILAYWLENVVIGVLNIPKILMSKMQHPGHRPDNLGARIFLVFFFCFHYILFSLIHATFIFMIIGEFSGMSRFRSHLSETFDVYLIIAIGILFLSHLFSFFTNFVKNKEYETTSAFQQMLKPYPRVFFVHGFILLGGYLLISMEQGALILYILFVLIKIGIDLIVHLKEHKLKKD